MARNVNLWEHMPPFLKKFKELDAIYQAEKPEFQKLADDNESMLDNLFIQTAQHEGLSRFEKILKLPSFSSDDLEQRRARILVQWIDIIPYTMRTLKEKLIAIQGNNQVEVYFSNPYELTIKTRLSKFGQVDSLEILLKSILPCNLVVIAENFFSTTNYRVMNNTGTGGIVSCTEMITLKG